MKFTACYTKTENGYTGQLLEWTNVITEGETLDECRDSLIDAANEMAIVYHEDGLEIPQPSLLIESISIPSLPLKPLQEVALANVS